MRQIGFNLHETLVVVPRQVSEKKPLPADRLMLAFLKNKIPELKLILADRHKLGFKLMEDTRGRYSRGRYKKKSSILYATKYCQNSSLPPAPFWSTLCMKELLPSW